MRGIARREDVLLGASFRVGERSLEEHLADSLVLEARIDCKHGEAKGGATAKGMCESNDRAACERDERAVRVVDEEVATTIKVCASSCADSGAVL